MMKTKFESDSIESIKTQLQARKDLFEKLTQDVNSIIEKEVGVPLNHPEAKEMLAKLGIDEKVLVERLRPVLNGAIDQLREILIREGNTRLAELTELEKNKDFKTIRNSFFAFYPEGTRALFHDIKDIEVKIEMFITRLLRPNTDFKDLIQNEEFSTLMGQFEGIQKRANGKLGQHEVDDSEENANAASASNKPM